MDNGGKDGDNSMSVSQLTRSLSVSCSFTHKSQSEHVRYMVSPEEIMGMIVMLQRLNEAPLHDLIMCCMEIIKRQQDKVDEEKAKQMSLKWAPKTMKSHQGDDDDVQDI